MHGHWLKDYIGPKDSGGSASIPTPTVEDAGKVLAVSDEGQYGLANSGGGTALIVRPVSASSSVCDKTWQEVSDAYKAGLPIYFQHGSPTGSTGTRQQLQRITEPILGSGEYKVEFVQLTTSPTSAYTDFVADSADDYLHQSGSSPQ